MRIKVFSKDKCLKIFKVVHTDGWKDAFLYDGEPLYYLPDEIFGNEYDAIISDKYGCFMIFDVYASGLVIPPFFVEQVKKGY